MHFFSQFLVKLNKTSKINRLTMANSNVLVMKFGGTSVGKGVDKCVESVQQTQVTGKFDGLVVVTSALTQVCCTHSTL